MPAPFTNPANYPYRSGSLFLGLDPATNAPVGISTERHAITIAGSGSGKGATLLIPNALRWPHNLLVVDPKGEIANATWQAREALGQQVAVLDPFGACKTIPDHIRASFNPLAGIDLESPLARDEIRVIADGLVKRHKAEDGDWYDGAVRIIGGILAFVLEAAPPDQRNFAAMRSVLLQPNEALHETAQAMQQCEAFDGLAKDAATAIIAGVTSDRGGEKTHLSMARASTLWMDHRLMKDAMATSTFDLAALRSGKLSLFLVLPPRYLDEYSTFLRLFVRAAINAMMDDEATTERRCLFMLDEFYSLGKLDIVAKAAGLMRGYGLHLWPFMQDLGQLRSLYGEEMADTFFSNADAAIFFGNSDRTTLQYISGMIGPITADEIGQAFVTPSSRHLDGLAAAANRQPLPMPIDPKKPYGWAALSNDLDAAQQNASRAKYERKNRRHQESVADARAQHDHKMRAVGSPRIEPSAVAELIGKKDGDTVARSAIVFAKGGDVLNVRLQPYFLQPHFRAGAAPAASSFIDRERVSFGGIHPAIAYGAIFALGLVIYANNTGNFSFGLGFALTIYGGFGLGVTAVEVAKPRLAKIPRPPLKQTLAYLTLIVLGLLLVAATGQRDGIGGIATALLMLIVFAAFMAVAISGWRDIFRWIRRR